MTNDPQHPVLLSVELTGQQGEWFRLIVDYLSNGLSADKRAEVEQRLANDPEFAAFCEPVKAVWEVDPWCKHATLPPEESKLAWERLRLSLHERQARRKSEEA
jgi:hypothetical protein